MSESKVFIDWTHLFTVKCCGDFQGRCPAQAQGCVVMSRDVAEIFIRNAERYKFLRNRSADPAAWDRIIDDARFKGETPK